ncbi:MAG: DUF222 domain-containing protein [Egibacteraceae bacterium]
MRGRSVWGRRRSRCRRRRSCVQTCGKSWTGSSPATAGGWTRRRLRERVDEWTHTVDPEALGGRERRAWANRRASVTSDGLDGSGCVEARLDPVGIATLTAALDPLARKTGHADERTYPQRLADALVELARRSLDSGGLPQVAVQRPHVILIATAEALDGKAGASAARLDGVGPVSSATAQMVCCDAETDRANLPHPPALNGTRNGEVLDAGRTRRQPTKAQRVAVIARDRVCVGCGALASRCQVHRPRQPPPPAHPKGTRDLEPTDEENLCLTCWDCITRFTRTAGSWPATRTPAGSACTRPTRTPENTGDERADLRPTPPTDTCQEPTNTR